MLELPKLIVTGRDDDGIAAAAPLQTRGLSGEITVIGAIDVSRSTSFLDDAKDDDRLRAILLVALIATAATIAVGDRRVEPGDPADQEAAARASTTWPRATCRTCCCPSATTRSARSRPGSTR